MGEEEGKKIKELHFGIISPFQKHPRSEKESEKIQQADAFTLSLSLNKVISQPPLSLPIEASHKIGPKLLSTLRMIFTQLVYRSISSSLESFNIKKLEKENHWGEINSWW